MTRADLILKSMLAYIQQSPPPIDVATSPVRQMSTKAGQARYEKMACYVDEQLVQSLDRSVIERCAKIAEAASADTGDGEGEIYIARKIADRIRAMSP